MLSIASLALVSCTGGAPDVPAAAPAAAPGVAAAAVWPILGRETGCPYCNVVGTAFARASESIDILLASLDASANPVVEALVAAAGRGVAVRVLLDQSDFEPSITTKNALARDYLVAHGVDARLDDPATTTHAKLAIVDRAAVVIGSTNWNRYALFEHRQADVLVEDGRLAAAYGAWFDRLWTDPAARLPFAFASPPSPGEGSSLVALPDAGESTLYASFVVDALGRARRSVHAILYRISVYPQFADSATSDLVRALVAAAGRGLDVRVLMDDCSFYADSAQANLESAIYLYQSGVEVRFDDPAETTHAKLLVIDGETVILGSTNWNYYSVERNIEANLALVRMPEVAATFESSFATLWATGRAIVP